jgi:hypothetical protein
MDKNKILITGGCSFSDGAHFIKENSYRKTWTNYIKEKYNFKRYVHMAQPASGNEIIAERVIYALQTLLDSGHSSDNLYVGVMWSGIERKDLFVSLRETPDYENIYSNDGNNALLIVKSSINTNVMDLRQNKRVTQSFLDMSPTMHLDRGYIRSGGLPYKEDWWKDKAQRDYFNLWYDNFYSVEKQFIDTLKSILLVQTFCERHNIKYFMLMWQNIFSADNENGDLLPKTYSATYEKSRKKPLYVDVYKHTSKYLWDSLNFDKFIFFENKDVVYGGLGEYAVINNLEFWPDNGHINYKGHTVFVDEHSEQIEELWKIK